MSTLLPPPPLNETPTWPCPPSAPPSTRRLRASVGRLTITASLRVEGASAEGLALDLAELTGDERRAAEEALCRAWINALHQEGQAAEDELRAGRASQ